MGRPSHPLHERAVGLMKRGLATPGEIARACGIPLEVVRSWRKRAAIWSEQARLDHVRRLMMRGTDGPGGKERRPAQALRHFGQGGRPV